MLGYIVKSLIYRCRRLWGGHFYKTFFEGNNKVARSSIVMFSCIGYGTYMGNNCNLVNTKIGRYCSIADHVKVCLGTHPIDYVSTFPSFYYDTTSQIGFTFHIGAPLYKKIYKFPEGESEYQITIGNDVWIGSHTILLGGITIGNGAIVAAGSVVVKDVPPYSIVGGNPAKVIKMRFSEDVIDALEKIEWWNFSPVKIKENYKKFLDVYGFIQKYKS